LPLLDNGSANTPTKIEELLTAVFYVASDLRLHNEDARPVNVNGELMVCSAIELGKGD
jgi:hypothetical protein